MATRAYDTAIRANQSGWGTASDGNTWAFGGAASTNAVASNELSLKANANVDTFAQLGSTAIGDQEILCRIALSDNVGDVCGVVARYSAAGANCYKLLYYSNALHLNKSVAGTGSNLANSGAFTPTNSVFYWFKLRLQGTTLSGKCWQSGTVEPASWQITVTDSSLNTGGFAVLGNTGSAGGILYDHFHASSLNTILSDGYGGAFS